MTDAGTSGVLPPRTLLRSYLFGLIGLAIAVLVVAAATTPLTLTHHWTTTALVFLLVIEGQLLRVRSQYRRTHHDLNFVEAAVAVLFLGHTSIDVAVVAGLATAASMVIQKFRELDKALFNIAQWILASVAGVVVYDAITDATTGSAGAIVAVAAGIATVIIANQLAFTGVIWLAAGGPGARHRLGQDSSLLVGRLLNAVSVITVGVILTGAASWSRWTIACAFVPLALLHWASRGHAEARADRLRLAGLQSTTHALSVSFDVDEGIRKFLAQARVTFEADCAELWVLKERRLALRHRDGGAGASGNDAASADWLETLLPRLDANGVRIGTDAQPAPPDPRWLGALVVPLITKEKRLGAFCVLERTGMSGFEDGELAVAGALGAELVGFMERAHLVEAVIEERSKLQQIVEQTSDGILTLSPDGRIRSWNRALEQITGYFAVEMAGTAHLALIRPCDESGNEIALDRWVDIPDLPERVQIRTSSGETRWLSCSFTRVAATSDQDETLIVVARDVTAAHELERLKDDFVAVVSHELRTPLVPIKGWASMLLSRGDRMTPEQRHDALESIHAQAQRLERLVLNILDSSRIENGADHSAANVDVSVVASRVVEEMLPSAGGRAIRLLGVSERHLALGQPVWVERSLANLLANAVKYAPAGTDVSMSVSTEGNDVVVRVRDEGPGIPDGWTERIFERFERMPETDTQPGTGLGLYITRQLVTAMGGTVAVDKDDDDGTTFVMRLRASGQVPGPRSLSRPGPSISSLP
ncbi:MAG: ATP-binding protein [Actinomycetes bacterium]